MSRTEKRDVLGHFLNIEKNRVKVWGLIFMYLERKIEQHIVKLCMYGEALFPGLDLDSGLDWTLDWTLENMYFWCHCSTKEARGPVPCPLEAQTLIHVYVSW